MFRSLKQLYKAPYNRIHPFFALYRYLFWKWIRVFKITNITCSFWNGKKIELNYDNLQSAWLMYNYWVDWEEFNLIKDVLKGNDVVFDIGSNIGFYTIWMSKFITGLGRIHSFEPDEKSYSRLIKNIEINHINHLVTANRMAISDERRVVKFTNYKDGENQIAGKDERNYQIIPCTTIDQYIADNEITKIKYIKIDIEGFEYQALLGAISTLKSGIVDIFQLEINSQIQNSGSKLNKLLDLITAAGYKLCSYDIQSKKLIPIAHSKSRENYFMVKNCLTDSI